jgi:hypothetical protein
LTSNGEFVQIPVQGEPMYKKVNKYITMYTVEMFPELEEFTDEGCLYTLMLNVMYGCVQASPLWYALIQAFLEDQRYEVSQTEMCAFCKKNGNRIYILLL